MEEVDLASCIYMVNELLQWCIEEQVDSVPVEKLESLIESMEKVQGAL